MSIFERSILSLSILVTLAAGSWEAKADAGAEYSDAEVAALKPIMLDSYKKLEGVLVTRTDITVPANVDAGDIMNNEIGIPDGNGGSLPVKCEVEFLKNRRNKHKDLNLPKGSRLLTTTITSATEDGQIKSTLAFKFITSDNKLIYSPVNSVSCTSAKELNVFQMLTQTRNFFGPDLQSLAANAPAPETDKALVDTTSNLQFKHFI